MSSYVCENYSEIIIQEVTKSRLKAPPVHYNSLLEQKMVKYIKMTLHLTMLRSKHSIGQFIGLTSDE